MSIFDLPDMENLEPEDVELQNVSKYKHIKYTYRNGQLYRVCDHMPGAELLVPIKSLEYEYNKDMAKAKLIKSGELLPGVLPKETDPNNALDLEYANKDHLTNKNKIDGQTN